MIVQSSLFEEEYRGTAFRADTLQQIRDVTLDWIKEREKTHGRYTV